MDVKKIRTCGYPCIKPATSRKWIPVGNGYGYLLYPLVNEAGTGIIVSILVDTHTCYTLI